MVVFDGTEYTIIEWDEYNRVAYNMIKRGGGFVNALGEALMRGDIVNRRKIKDAFPEYWKEYSMMVSV